MTRSRTRWVCKIFGLIGFGFLLYKFVDRSGLMDLTGRYLPPREAAVAMGLGWGNQDLFDKDLKQKFKETGLLHLVVASGTNVMLATGLIVEGLAPILGRKWAIMMVWIWMWWYAGIAKWQAPIVRASLMTTWYYWAQMLGRKYDWKRSLLVAVIMLIILEKELSLSLGMSVVAFIGTKIYSGKNELIRSVVVSIVMWPLLAVMFGQTSLVGPLMTWLAMTVAEGLTVAIWILSLLGGWGLAVLYPGLRYIVWLTEVVGRWHWATVNFKINWWMVAGIYCLMWWGRRKYVVAK